MKPFDECCLQFIKRKIKPISSVTQETFVLKEMPYEQPILPITMPSAVTTTNIVIDRSKEGISKYLDPNATTYNLSYVAHSKEALSGGIAAHDNLTFWNWSEKVVAMRKVSREPDPILCDEFPSQKCTKRRCEFQNELKPVPHSGMVTEVRENYIDPLTRKVEFDPEVTPKLVSADVIPFAKKSEYAIYGSGEPVVKYV